MPVQERTPSSNNSIDVMFKADDASHPEELTLYNSEGTTKITDIDFPSDKKFIRFAFPTGYSDYDIRVFETSEKTNKTTIMDAYDGAHSDGISKFNAQWNGEASSGGKKREFKLRTPQNQKMVLRDLDDDGTTSGTLHDYIVKFTYNNTEYLLDPSIRNKN